jgi:hypothetical protein
LLRHKLQAAAETGRPIRLLAYVAGDASIASDEDVDTVLRTITAS